MSSESVSTGRRTAGRLLLLIPYVALLWLPFYNDTRPSFVGFPFFLLVSAAMGAADVADPVRGL